MRPLYILLPALAAVTVGALAQEETPQITPPLAPTVAPVPSDEPEVTLEELVRQALENNPRLQVSREELAAAQSRAQAVGAFPNPSLQLVPGFSGNRESRDEEIILAQPLDVFGVRRARANIGAAEVRRLEAENRLARWSLEIEVRNAAALLFADQETEKLEQAQVETAQLFRDAAAKRAALGDVPGVQVQRADLELLRVQNDLARAKAQRLVQRTVLNALIGASANAPLRVTLPLDLAANAPTDTPANLLAARPDLVSAQARLEARQAEVKALGRERLPQFELQARHAPFIGRDEGSTAIRAVINVPLFDFGALKGQRRAAQAEVRAQEATIKVLNQQAALQLESAQTQLQSRRETALRYRDQIVPLTLELLRKTQIGYAQGASTYLEVLEAQRTLRQVQSEYLQALVGVQSSQTALDAALNGGTMSRENFFDNSALRGETP